jgi:hypothetical protein
MHKINRGKSTHADKLENWLGKEQVEAISAHFKNFYYPVPLNGVPGNIFVMPGGDFAGEIQAGAFGTAQDGAANVLRRLLKQAERLASRNNALGMLVDMIRANDRRMASIGAFASVDAVIAAFTGGKGQQLNFTKTGVASNATANSNDLWTRAGQPAAGAAGSAAPGGVAPTSSTTGALGYKNLGAAGSGHYSTGRSLHL